MQLASALLAGARYFAALPAHLLRHIDPSQARTLVKERLARRGDLLLDRLRHDVFAFPSSPYGQLMRYAGCTLGDLEKAVRADGVEATLRQLLRAGVYLTVDEFKGRAPIRRGASLHLEVRIEDLRSPRAAYHIAASSGGSRGSGTPVLFDLRFVRTSAAGCLMSLDAWGGAAWTLADWETPGHGARFRLTKFGMIGRRPPQAWFSQIDPNDALLPPVVKWNTLAMKWSSRLAGRPLPGPIACTLDDPRPIVRWLTGILQSGHTPLVFTYPGSAVRACSTAMQLGIPIEGARFLVSGEPITPARIATYRQAGCEAIPRYGSIECGAIGYGCPHGEHSDDVHLMAHMHAVLQAAEDAPRLGSVPAEALLVTNLHQHSPFLMLNTSMGDQAGLTRRSCGCLWDRLGFGTHLHNVRSYEKLTGGGVTFHAGDIISILEEVLPRRFGGTPTDYQLVETESERGDPVLTLRVNPSVTSADPQRVGKVFLDSLSSSPSLTGMARLWRDSGALRVVLEPPVVSRVGKILHLHVNPINRPRI